MLIKHAGTTCSYLRVLRAKMGKVATRKMRQSHQEVGKNTQINNDGVSLGICRQTKTRQTVTFAHFRVSIFHIFAVRHGTNKPPCEKWSNKVIKIEQTFNTHGLTAYWSFPVWRITRSIQNYKFISIKIYTTGKIVKCLKRIPFSKMYVYEYLKIQYF